MESRHFWLNNSYEVADPFYIMSIWVPFGFVVGIFIPTVFKKVSAQKDN